MADILNSIIHSSDNAIGGLYNAMAIRENRENTQFNRNRLAQQDERAAEQNAYARGRDQIGDKRYHFEQAAKIVGGRPENVQRGIDYLAMNGPPPDPRVGEMLVAYGQSMGGGDDISLTVTPLIDANGNLVPGQATRGGRVIASGLQEGYTMAPVVNWENVGNALIPTTRHGVAPTGVGPMPIAPAPEQMPEFRSEVTRRVEEEKAAVKKQKTFPKVQAMIKSEESQHKFVNETIEDAIALADKAAGYGSYLSWVNSSDYKALAQMLVTIKANISFGKLQEMRANSPTGGALGNISDKENERLEAVAGSLDQGLEPVRLKRNLTRAKELRQETLDNLRGSFAEDYEEFIQPEQPQGAAPARDYEAEYNVR